jgi:amino acid permease
MVTTILLIPVLSIIGGLFSSIISTPGVFYQEVLKVEVSNEQLLQRLLIHSFIIFILVLIYYPLLKNRLKRKRDKVEIDIKSNHSLKDLFKKKDQSERDKQKEWIDKNFK